MPEPNTTTLAHFTEIVSTIEDDKGNPAATKYRLMGPDDGSPTQLFPLVVFLHGAGERGNDNRTHLLYLPETLARPESRRRYPCYALAVQCPASQKWVEVPWEAEQSAPQAAEPSAALKTAMAVLDDVMHTWPIDPKRVYLTGMSMGGYGAWDWAMREPKRFAALAPICGGGDETKAALIKDLPIWTVHGEKDQAVPVVRSRRMVEALRAAGGSPKYSELEGVGHNAWTKAYTPEFGLLDWMFEQKRG
jgi:predicted peptidase